MAKLPDDGDRGELWHVRVPVVFDIASRSWMQLAGSSIRRSPHGLSEHWPRQEDSYPSLNTLASTQRTFLADLTTIEVLRALVETEVQESGTPRVLIDAEVQQLRLTVAAVDRYVEIPDPP